MSVVHYDVSWICIHELWLPWQSRILDTVVMTNCSYCGVLPVACMPPDDGRMTETCCGNNRRGEEEFCVHGPLITELIHYDTFREMSIALSKNGHFFVTAILRLTQKQMCRLDLGNVC
jgi:hypothetical protein